MKIKGLISENTVVLKYQGEEINIQRSQDEQTFLKVSQLLIDRDEKELIKQFIDIKARIEQFSNGVFTVQNDKIVLKGDNIPLPQAIAKKLLEMEKEGEDFLPLIRFWKKLRNNPSKNSREQLYGFMLANNIPLTEQGDLVVEKGVNQRRGGIPGELVDVHTKSIDNSVGMIVEMDRSRVADNPKVHCSTGLHVGAPDYVRKHWSSDVIVECVVNPVDVVSVPDDYNNTKMRVCRYQVMGYSDKSRTGNKVVKLSDFIKTPTPQLKESMEQKSIGVKSEGNKIKDDRVTSNKQGVIQMQNETLKQIEGKTAKQIIAHVKEITGEEITISLKNKRGIIKKGLQLLELHQLKLTQGEVMEEVDQDLLATNSKKTVKQMKTQQEEVIDLTSKSRQDLLELAKSKFNLEISKYSPTKGIINKLATQFEQAGFKVIK